MREFSSSEIPTLWTRSNKLAAALTNRHDHVLIGDGKVEERAWAGHGPLRFYSNRTTVQSV